MVEDKKEAEKPKMSKVEAGRLGGQTTKERYGMDHFNKLAKGNSERLKAIWSKVPKKLRKKTK